LTHYSRKGRKGAGGDTKARPKKVEGIFGSKRKAPIIIEGKAAGPSRRKRRRKGTVDESLISHARKVTCLYPPGKAAVESLKRKLEGKKEAEDIEVTPRAVQRRLRGKQKEPPPLRTLPRQMEEKQQQQQPIQQNVKVPVCPAVQPQHQQQPQQQQQQRHEDKTKDKRKQVAATEAPSKRRAKGCDGAGDKAQEEEAIKRIATKRVREAPKSDSPQYLDETDDELIEAVWQELVNEDASRKLDANAKKPRLEDPVYDPEPRLPGNCGTTAGIKARLWSKMHGRPSVNRHSACQEGKQSENLAWRARGSTSERASKFQRGTAGRIHKDDISAIERLMKHGTATSSSSSKAGLGGSLKEPP